MCIPTSIQQQHRESSVKTFCLIYSLAHHAISLETMSRLAGLLTVKQAGEACITLDKAYSSIDSITTVVFANFGWLVMFWPIKWVASGCGCLNNLILYLLDNRFISFFTVSYFVFFESSIYYYHKQSCGPQLYTV